MFGKLIGLRSIAQVVDGNAAAEIDVFERVSRLAMNRDQMFPHAPECFSKRLYIGRLRSNVDMDATDFDEIRFLEATTKRVEHFRR